jgi:hypothetical protein
MSDVARISIRREEGAVVVQNDSDDIIHVQVEGGEAEGFSVQPGANFSATEMV